MFQKSALLALLMKCRQMAPVTWRSLKVSKQVCDICIHCRPEGKKARNTTLGWGKQEAGQGREMGRRTSMGAGAGA